MTGDPTPSVAPAAASIEPWSVLARVLLAYRDQAPVLLPLAGIVNLAEALRLGDARAQLAVALIVAVPGVLIQGVAAQLVHDAGPVDGQRPAALARGAVRAVLPTVLCAIALGVAFGLGFLLVLGLAISFGSIASRIVLALLASSFFFLGLVLATRWAVVVPVAVIERTGAFAALRRSRALVRGNGLRVLATLALVFVPVIGLRAVVGALAGAPGTTTRALALAGLGTVTLPLYALTPAVLYFALLAVSPARRQDPVAQPPWRRWLGRPALVVCVSGALLLVLALFAQSIFMR